jgi:hypothetical protein
MSHFYLYHEGQVKRGPNEILLDYITNHVSETVKELFLFRRLSWPNRNNAIVRILVTLAANGRFNKIFQYFPIRGPYTMGFGLLEKNLHKINRVYTAEKHSKLIQQSSRKEKVAITMRNFNTQYKQWWPKFYKKNTMSLQSNGKAVPRAQKVIFSISQYYTLAHKDQEKPSPQI